MKPEQKRLAVVGAGPKAMAIAAKNTVLKKIGFSVPELVVIEKNEIASYWDGQHGFTNGRQPLGTSPEKDIGFPYYSHCWGEGFNSRVDAEMLAFSWQRYLVEQRDYSDWIDRSRPSPEHAKWARYLKWTYEKVKNEVQFIQGEVTDVTFAESSDRWKLHTKNDAIEVDGFVVTGPGRLRIQEDLPKDHRVKTLESFWKSIDEIQKIPPNSHVAVVGAGETAASIVVFLGHVRMDLTIDLIVPTAMSYSRGESYVENHVYTDPFQSNWMSWTKEDRKNFIQRTDRGVFSIQAKHYLDQWDFVEIIPGWFRSLKVNTGNQLVLEIEYNGDKEYRIYDFVALSLGFEPWAQVTNWMQPKTMEELKRRVASESVTQDWVESQISEDLSIGGLTPKIHIPMLAGMQQGPGFGNLSCLGRVADQILQSYVSLDLARMNTGRRFD